MILFLQNSCYDVSVRLAALVLVACSRGLDGRLSFEGAPPEAFSAAYGAVAEWNAACDTDLTLSSGPGSVAIVIVPAGSLGEHGGEADTDHDVVRIDERFAAEREMYAHELGHMLRLDHKPVGIMSGSVIWGTHVTRGDCP